MFGKTTHAFCITLALFASIGCSQNDASRGSGSISEVTLALNWYAEAEHGGYVAISELELLKGSGFAINLQQGGPGAPNLVIQELAAGRIKFAVSNADLVVLARAKGVPLVALAAPLQMSPRCIMVHEASGFESLEDLSNIELAISDSRPFALWMQHKLPLTNVTMVPFSGSVGEFLQKPNFAQQAYVFSEPFVAKEKGGDPKALMLSDIGFNPYSSLLVTTETVIEQEPELVKSIVHASIEGWKQYLSDPEAVNTAINSDNADMSLASLEYGVAAMKPLCETSDPLCSMTLERWTELVSQIEELKEIEPGSVSPQECFDTSFLP